MSRGLELPPLPSDVLSLIERTRPGVEPPAAVRAELRARLGPALSLPLPTAPTAAPRLGRLAHRTVAMLSKKVPLARVSFGLGAGTGATVAVRAVRASMTSGVVAKASAIAHAEPPPPLEAPVPAAPPAPAAPSTAPEPRPRAQPPRPAARTVPVVAPPATTIAPVESAPDRLLAAERVLIEKGRSALSRGDAAGALAAVAEHARIFPQGSLGEERDALRIQSLAAAGRKAEAAAALADFTHGYPRSMLTPALRRALQ